MTSLRTGCPSKADGKTGRELVREATLEEPQQVLANTGRFRPKYQKTFGVKMMLNGCKSTTSRRCFCTVRGSGDAAFMTDALIITHQVF